MKKVYVSLIILLSLLFVSGCSKNNDKNINTCIDLTKYNGIMLYSETVNILQSPDTYKGQTIKFTGLFDYFYDQTTNKTYYSVYVLDSAGCCSAGFEFEPVSDYKYPEDFPGVNENITVEGIFDTYEENGYNFAVLKEANIIKN